MERSTKQKIELPYLDDYLLDLKTNNYSPQTVYNYERDLVVFEEFLKQATLPFSKLDKKMIMNYKAYLLSKDRKTAGSKPGEKKLSSFSVNRMLSALRSYLKYLNDMDYKLPVPPDAVKLIKTPKKNPKVPNFQKIVNLIESPSHFENNQKVALRNRAMLEVLFSTGMRVSELVNFKINDLDNRGRIFVRGKGKKERFVYLTDRAKDYLKKYLEVRGNTESPYVFVPYSGRNVNKKRKRISANYIQQKIKKYRNLLGLNIPVSAHTIRHAFATYLAESGASPAAIQVLLGHESLDTTTRYVNPRDRYAEKVHRKYHPLKKS